MAQELNGPTTVIRGYIDGCFDMMHSGHYNAIRQAKAICDVLVVGVHSDVEIEENKSIPVMRQDERYALLTHIKWIDEILHDVPYSPQLATLERARADFCIHGDDMPVNSQGVCAYDEMKHAGRLQIIKRTEGVSTTDIIGRLLTLSRGQHTTSHPLTRPAAHSTGVRINADEAIERCAMVACPGSAAVAETQDLIRKLAEQYQMTATDEAKLREGLRVSCEAAAHGGHQLAPCTTPAQEVGAENTRTSAAVQLLASTRRISEFSSGRQPGPEDRVVYVRGSFDMFHVGHAQFLKEAKALGSFLLVGINEDLVISRAKGPYLPVMSLNERVLNVCACKWVDEVIIAAPRDVTEDLVKTWDIHVVARSTGHERTDEAGCDPNSAYAVPKRLGIYAEIPSRWPDLCYATVVQRVIENREQFQKRNRDRARREDVYYASKASTVFDKHLDQC